MSPVGAAHAVMASAYLASLNRWLKSARTDCTPFAASPISVRERRLAVSKIPGSEAAYPRPRPRLPFFSRHSACMCNKRSPSSCAPIPTLFHMEPRHQSQVASTSLSEGHKSTRKHAPSVRPRSDSIRPNSTEFDQIKPNRHVTHHINPILYTLYTLYTPYN